MVAGLFDFGCTHRGSSVVNDRLVADKGLREIGQVASTRTSTNVIVALGSCVIALQIGRSGVVSVRGGVVVLRETVLARYVDTTTHYPHHRRVLSERRQHRRSKFSRGIRECCVGRWFSYAPEIARSTRRFVRENEGSNKQLSSNSRMSNFFLHVFLLGNAQ
ncbi:hypothetical protein THAOC_12200 [Thalassiosira oceanica]|uniref:Uncharacterized protein n=1 Tax=Thalassiosira oceanica TaxID=159749 RepID=K0SPB9_THAOC|nr:hypothetical protein THAOC_12200 [Thalassiosira oceanica]|eukprot:EJK66839.1 hypothetical protein THAOC_12200 [Thalassiosira oceanica]